MELNLSLRETYRLLRYQKKIKLKDIAVHVGVSIPMLSMYENETVNLSRENERKYRELIVQMQPA
jgi:transcriptional regulator with XRE-family HTH domain